ncbi:polyribonucleotide nucleotidyltransferase [Virgibacillus halodenitrificans]|jgi:polyribonucleotide nucleotidyltransferase|uniref:Polyribonucleotide nucleotidyltransferase n=1 Tax=Virgibacillus halodenitrificans TaxID=1482 RepID=A0AAC9IZD1_VIRHA|nr:polyribonucleotide nucleotidyltransferase [Virgibacillus halodenitrificans]APC48586.1 polyribonucleotide nucleotidyltransferase [Virgibacillus halodenitrificans]MBD1224211.1 polyribonucleotide nucleotidyltransferase [Virgibacillus halodenitrificans]MCG1028746.1 polyribonucleotide nucleotidyltransferase [Virgibacillus halodenitrificans]MCJ0931160.1 polyribonucleotide nucleotidyltransferase [Virgibacillus halodenitrificans]MEC2160345.1 polyribonucleotide nucleotidyltransferase [Virgibacillus 
MADEKKQFSTEIAGNKFTVEVGELAKQANGACMIHYGETAVLSVATASKEPKDLPFFPLTVNYEERLYAVGKIPGGFIKREGRPSEKAILSSRLIDRPIRPLFPDGFRNEVQVISTVMSVDQDCSSEIAAMIGSSIALSISDIPFEEPIAGVHVGRVDGEFVINPTIEQEEKSDIDLTVAGTKDAINMVEAGANEVPEEVMLEAIMFGHKEIIRLVEFQEEIVRAVGLAKSEVTLFELDEELTAKIEAEAKDKLVSAIQVKEKHAREEAISNVKKEVVENYEEEEEGVIKQVKSILDKMVKEEVRRLITKEKIRPDGRKIDEIRPLSSRINILPRTHGSGLFTRGQTQALSVCTLGALGDVQILDGLDLEESKRFMHHYNFPQYSVGETGPIRGPGRREIGHGALGERALEKVVPSDKDFPYTIRLVSEVLESNGSTSQASICASTLAMMAAGVPIKAPVAGIAMGLVKSGEDYSILTDIQGMEDALGDMDFKVAGTAKGVTALQMDIKIDGLSKEILKEALSQAKKGRMQILDSMLETIKEPNKELSAYAPKILTMNINPDKIRDVIGPSGKQINKIIEETGVKIDIEQDGKVFISSTDSSMNDQAKKIIEDIVREVEAGQMYLGKVKRIEKFGAFVELFKGKDGLVHISELAEERTNKVEDVVSIGDEILVKVKEVDNQGRVNLSRKAVLKEERERKEKENS